jgi:serine/threonine protein kinase
VNRASAPERAPDIPGPFGDYTLLTRFARGGMADVYLAELASSPIHDITPERLEDGSFLALKLLLPSLAGRRKFVDMFQSEGRLGLLLRHPNIVETLDVGVADGHHYIAMSFIAGHNLGQLIRYFASVQAPVPLDVALFVIDQVLAGLEHTHTLTSDEGAPLDLVNRDVSPANIMLGYDGHVRLIDFGIAQALLDYRSQIGSIKGKVVYMSPEQVRGLPLDARSDLFSLGTVLYQLLTGREPFQAPTEFDQMERVREARPPAAHTVSSRVDEALSSLVARAMEKDASARFGSAAEMREALRAYCTEAEILLEPTHLARVMRAEFVRQRQKVLDDLLDARALLEPATPVPEAEISSPRRRDEQERRARSRREFPTENSPVVVESPETPRWLLPALILTLCIAAALLAVVLFRGA